MKLRIFAIAATVLALMACKHTPEEIAVTGVKLSESSIELTAGDSKQLTATVLPSNASNKGVRWATNIPDVATVSEDGTVTALAMGAATITVTTLDGGFKADCAVIVKKRLIPVQSVALSMTSVGLTVGSSVILGAKITPADADDRSVSWSATPASVVTVEQDGHNGIVTAVGPGEGTVTVTTNDGGLTATCTVTVEAATIDVESSTLSAESLELKEGETATLTATVLPEDATDKTVEWSSMDSDVATVDQEGNVTAVSAGQTNIRATSGGKEATCQVTVSKIAVDGVTVTPATLELMEGASYQLSASVSPADADQSVEWVSESHIATVDRHTGLVTAVSQGSTRIFARSVAFPDKQAWCELTITPDPTLKGISLSSAIMTLMVGESRTLEVIFDPPYAQDKAVSWESSDVGVASVGENGTVTAFSEGTAVITATSHEGGFTASCTVTVSGSAGPQVYYWETLLMYINGAPDPRNGIFNTEDSFLREYMSGVGLDYYDGSVYSIEYWVLEKHYSVVLCKDRKPFITLPLTEKMSGNISGFAVRDNFFAILTGTQSEGYTLFRGDFLGNVETIPVSGSYINMYYPKMATTPDGSIHIVANIKDSFWNKWIATYSIRPEENTVTEALLESSDGDPSIAVDAEENVYVFFDRYLSSEKGYDCVLLKNGTEVAVIDSIQMNYNGAIACHGTEVYMAVSDYTGQETRLYKGSQKILTIKTEAMIYLGDVAPLKVSPSGDVYLVLRANGSFLYKNGELLYSGSNWAFDPYCVAE